MPNKTIESRHNAAFKLLKDLAAGGRVRRPHHAAWLEGARLCESYVQHCHALPKPTDPGASQAAEIKSPILVVSSEHRLDAIDPSIQKSCGATWLVDAKLFAEISQVETPSGWGMVVPVWIPCDGSAPDIQESTVLGRGRQQGDVVVLDRLQDPGNAGTILRSAAASGVTEIWSITGTVDLWSPKVLRAAMGAHFVLSIAEQMTTDSVVLRSQDLGLSLLATANAPSALSLYADELCLTGTVAWVFGQEGDGVSGALLARAQQVVIPQSAKVESLNVAAAASVCLFEAMRQKQRSFNARD